MGRQTDFENRSELRFPAISENEAFARVCVGAFAAALDPTLEELSDIKTAVSEAVTNVAVHAYPAGEGEVFMKLAISHGELSVEIADRGIGIPDISQALQPFWSGAQGEERSGMGFTLMSAFMDALEVTSSPGVGTRIFMRKIIGE